MRILLINHYAGSIRHGMEYRPYYMAREWVREGHDVTIVAATSSHVRTKRPDARGLITREDIDGIHYIWLRTPHYTGNGAGRILNMLCFVTFLMLLAVRFSRELRPDAVIASSTYPLDIFPAFLIARFARARLAFEVHDLWPLSPMELGNMSKWHPAIIIMQVAENFAYSKADVVVSMLPKAKDHMVQHGMAPEKFVHVPNGICVEDWQEAASAVALPSAHAAALQEARAQESFVVCYAGAHGIANALDTFVEAGRLVAVDGIILLLVGQGPEKCKLESLGRGLGNVIFLPPVPKAAVPALLAGVDAVYIGLKKQPLFRFGVSPNKLLDYLMAGRPILNAIEAGNDLVEESGSGVTVPAENAAAVAVGLRRLKAASASERATMGENGRRFALKHHEYRQLSRAFLAALQPPHTPTVASVFSL